MAKIMPLFQRKYNFIPLLAVTLVLGALGLTGCGIKPDSLSAPKGEEASTFPRTYPAPDNAAKP